MYTHFRLGHTRKMKYPCFKRGYLLAGELGHQHRKQLGICTRQCVMLLSNLISMDKSSYISHIYFFQNSICIQRQATAVHTVSSAPASPGTTLLVGEGRGGPFSWVLYLSPRSIVCSLHLLFLYSLEFSLPLTGQCLITTVPCYN